MKVNEILNEAKEGRIPTGVGRTTVQDPTTYDGGDYLGDNYQVNFIDKYVGPPEGIDLGPVQERTYEKLQEVLERNGDSFREFRWAKYTVDHTTWPDRHSRQAGFKPDVLTRFVGIADKMVWEKYEGTVAGGGRNTVYVGGRKMKMTDFVKLSPEEQDRLVSLDAEAGHQDQMSSIPPEVKSVKAVKAIIRKVGGGLNRTDSWRIYGILDKLTGEVNRKVTDKEWLWIYDLWKTHVKRDYS